MEQHELRVGIPKGSLEEATIALFAKAGWNIRKRARNYFPDVDDIELVVRLCKVQEIPRYVADGILDCGFTGKDWIQESKADVRLVSDLMYSKASNGPARWVLAVAGDAPYLKPEDLAGKRIATEIIGLTERYFADRNVPVRVEYSWGATEAKVADGLADAIVEITETGATIRAHGLRIIDEVMVSNTQFIACPSALEDSWKHKKIDQINMLLQGALRAESLVGLKMNVRTKDLQPVIDLLPSLNSPTIASLRDSDWHALEAIVSISTVRNLIPRLVDAGAEGIIEYPLNKVI